MKSLIDIISWIVGLAATAGAIWYFYKFATTPGQGGTHFLWYAIGLAVVACACALVFFLRRVNKEEEIHITQ